MRKNPPFSAPGARASGHLARQFRRLGFSWVWFSFVSLILWVFISLCYFWALDMAPTYAVPGLFYSILNYDGPEKSVHENIMFFLIFYCRCMSFAEFQKADFAHSFYKTKLLFILIISLRTVLEFFGWMQLQHYSLLVSEYDQIWPADELREYWITKKIFRPMRYYLWSL